MGFFWVNREKRERERGGGREKGKKGDEKHLRLGRFVRSATSVCCVRKQRTGQERIALDG